MLTKTDQQLDQTILSKAVVRAAGLLGIPDEVLAAVLGIDQATVSRLVNKDYLLSKDCPEWELRIMLVRVYRALDLIFGDTSKEWIINENTVFEERRPIDVIQTVDGLRNICGYLEEHCDVNNPSMSHTATHRQFSVMEWFSLPPLGKETKAALDDRLARERNSWENDITTKESRERLAKIVTRLFGHWGLSSSEQCSLLGLAPTSRMTLSRYRKGGAFDNKTDLLGRVGHLLGIHKNLRIIFPENRDLAYQWVKAPNQSFDGKPPLEIMCKGYEGLLAVRRYLDLELGR